MKKIPIIIACALLLFSCSKESGTDVNLPADYQDCSAIIMETSTASPQNLKYVDVKASSESVYIEGDFVDISKYSKWYHPLQDGYIFSTGEHRFFAHGGYHYLLYSDFSEISADVYCTTSIIDCIKAKCSRIYSDGGSGSGSGSQDSDKATYKGKVTSYHKPKSGSSYSVTSLYIYEYYDDLKASLSNLGTTATVNALYNVHDGADPFGLNCNKYVYVQTLGWYYFKW